MLGGQRVQGGGLAGLAAGGDHVVAARRQLARVRADPRLAPVTRTLRGIAGLRVASGLVYRRRRG